MNPLWFVFVVLIVLVARITGHNGYAPKAMQTIGVLGGIAVMLMLVMQCMGSGAEGARGGRRRGRGRHHGGGGCGGGGCGGNRHRPPAGARAIDRVLYGGGGGWTGYVPWWLYPSYYMPWGGYGGYGGTYGYSGYGPYSYMPQVVPLGPCAQGCTADSTGSYGCPTPGYFPGQCRFASDCAGCAPGGMPGAVVVA